MSAQKITLLVVYVILALLALTQSGGAVGVWSLRILVLLAVVHAVEVIVFFKLCRRAGGSLVGHLLQVFLFGVLHAGELRAQAAGNPNNS
ncbi:MAG: hypothetical protein R3228_10505 [Halioglobus sp.]|nr:hypothetical protein [Halioglobus sp.]